MQGVLSKSKNVAPRMRGWLKSVAVVLALASGLTAGLATQDASAADQAYPVVRFYNERTGTHFYTIDSAERDQVLRLYPWFDYEGVQFYAYKTQVTGSQPVYRFFNTSTGTHFYTIVPAEKDYVLQHFPVYAFEGPVYYAMPAPMSGSEDLYRFFNTRTGAHFYTTSAPERDHVKATWPWFTYEGVAYQVFSDVGAGGGGGGGGGTTPTTTALFSSANPAAVGASVTFVATVTGTTPTGTFAFTDNGATLTGCSAVGIGTSGNSGTAICTSATLTAGSHTILAAYSGDATNAGSNNTLVETITGGGGGGTATTTSVSSSANPATAGTMVTFTATVTGSAPSGTVSFSDNGSNIGCGAVTLGGAGTATCATSTLGQGTHTILASYGGDASNLASSGMVSQVINAGGGGGPGPTTTTLVTSANPAASGAMVTFTATVTGTNPTGSVNFIDGANSISNCAVVNLTGSGNSRTAVCTTSTLTVATHSIFARYSGDVGNAVSTSTSISETITGTPAALVPKVSFTLSNTLLIAPQTVTITAAATETGGTIVRVSLYLDGAKLADLTASPYTFTTAPLAAGTHLFYATATDAVGNVTSTLTQNAIAISGPPPVVTQDANVWRLLNQATFGASQKEAATVAAMGVGPWIDNQFVQPVSGYPNSKYNVISLKTTLTCNTQDPAGKAYPADSPQAVCARDHLTLAGIQRDFFTNAVNAPDQLRQRVAWALSQITVTSGNEPDLSYAYVMSRYQSIVFNNAFGNYQTLLQQITLSPAMGNYLDMVNNDRASGSRVANENYAREIMQLFSVGLEELNDDGTTINDAQGVPVPTYDQNTIKEFAKIFTGYTFADPVNPTAPATKKNAPYYEYPMVTYPTTANAGHETSAKTLLPLVGGTVIPANQTPQQDLDSAVQNVFQHASTPAYISRQLIQRLVTGNPTPAFIGRISAVFKNNGAGVRGDLKAVVKAILLDTEARNVATPRPDFGSLREPSLAVTAAIRALNGITDGNRLAAAASNLGQNPYFSPTVFNYFPPDATIPGTSTLAPEFAIHTTNSAIARANLLYTLVYQGYAPDPTIPNATGTRLDLSQFSALAANPTAMVDKFSDVLLGGQLDPQAQALVEIAVNAVTLSTPPTNAQLLARAQMAAYLILSSYHFQVQH
jgi:uncharacterized protein (DUF1800 family)